MSRVAYTLFYGPYLVRGSTLFWHWQCQDFGCILSPNPSLREKHKLKEKHKRRLGLPLLMLINQVARGGGTERAWTGKYNDNKEKGVDCESSTHSPLNFQESTTVCVVVLPFFQARTSLTLDQGGPALWILWEIQRIMTKSQGRQIWNLGCAGLRCSKTYPSQKIVLHFRYSATPVVLT